MIARVAFLVQDLDALGGSERQANALAAAVAQREVDVTILTTTGPGLLDRPRDAWSEVRGAVQVYRLPLLAFEDAAGLFLSAARVDVIFAVGIMMGSIGARLAQLTGAELAVKLACSGEWGDMAWLAQLPPQQRREVQLELARATLVAISEDTAREAREAGFAPERLVRIPNGVAQPPPTYPNPLGQPAQTPTVLFAGRLDRQKGLDLLIEAFAAVTTPAARLLVAGEGPERGTLEALAAALDLTDRITFLGRRDDVHALMATATVVCLPSRGEGISNTLLEALALGVPVLASAIPANLEVVGEGEDACGATAPPEDPAALAAALERLLGDADLRARYRAAGPRRVAERYAMSVVADRYVELFARLTRARDPFPGPVRLLGRLTRARTGQVRRVLRRVLGSGDA